MLLTVATVDDAETEPDGSLELQVAMQSAGQQLGDAVTSAISILDNESLVTLERHNRYSYSVNEGRGAATLRLYIDPPVSRELAVNLRYTGDTGALAGTIEAVGDITGSCLWCPPTPAVTYLTFRSWTTRCLGIHTPGGSGGSGRNRLYGSVRFPDPGGY